MLGALGGGALAPLLAEQSGGGSKRLVVLTRASEGIEALAGVGHAGIVAPHEVVDTAAGRLAVTVFVPGFDLDELGELPAEVACAILQEVRGILDAVHQAGLAHGGLTPASVRVGPDGRVRLVGFRGGDPERDAVALEELAEVLDAELPSAAAPSVLGVYLAERGPPPSPQLEVHPASGMVLRPGAPQATPKARVASIAALTLLLGLGAGVFLRPVPVVVEVEVPGASVVVVECPGIGLRVEASGPRVRVPDAEGSCTVSASGGGTGVLDVDRAGRYRCSDVGGQLRCAGA